jgi:hypothetical protein
MLLSNALSGDGSREPAIPFLFPFPPESALWYLPDDFPNLSQDSAQRFGRPYNFVE